MRLSPGGDGMQRNNHCIAHVFKGLFGEDRLSILVPISFTHPRHIFSRQEASPQSAMPDQWPSAAACESRSAELACLSSGYIVLSARGAWTFFAKDRLRGSRGRHCDI
jgi:hypothetical protein